MATQIEKMATCVKALSYDEMIEVAEWFSNWTGIDEEGNDQARTISRETMAANLSDWAHNHKDM